MYSNTGLSLSAPTLVLVIVASILIAACGGGGGGSSSAAAVTPTPAPVVPASMSGYYPRAGNGGLNSVPTSTGNVLPIVVDAGPVAGVSQINAPYVSVTICTPGSTGSTAACQTIDHVLLDNGSSGLRILNASLYSNLTLPAVTHNGQAVGECETFGTGTTWGSVLLADIYLGGEVARSVPIQDIGDQPGGAVGVPVDCSNTGTILNTAALIGANGILGVGLFKNDCDLCLTQVVPATYYTCTSAGCSNSMVSAAQMVTNPVAIFSKDNNGVLITLPTVPNSGATSLAGSLIFGIGTESNNGLGSAVVYATDANGDFKTTYNGQTMSRSFIDSGSNGLYFNDSSIPTCSGKTWYCPASPLSLSATNTAATGGTSGVVNFILVNIVSLNQNVVAASTGGPYGSSQFDWGLPFFFNRPVFTAISGMSTPGGNGPYFAY